MWAGMLAVVHSTDVPRRIVFGDEVLLHQALISWPLLDDTAVVLWDPGSARSLMDAQTTQTPLNPSQVLHGQP